LERAFMLKSNFEDADERRKAAAVSRVSAALGA
jgi:hypothetical protein